MVQKAFISGPLEMLAATGAWSPFQNLAPFSARQNVDECRAACLGVAIQSGLAIGAMRHAGLPTEGATGLVSIVHKL